MAKSSDDFRFRARLEILFFLLATALLLGRLFFIQVRQHDYYKARADRQYTAPASKESVATRGDIYFHEKDGNLISAATIKEGYLLAINPALLTDDKEVCRQLREKAGVNEDQCIKKAAKKTDPFEELIHKIDFSAAEKIKDLKLPGILLVPEQWRFNPGNSLASHVLGFVGYEGNDMVGRYGLEEYYEDILKGKKEGLKKNSSFASAFFDLGKKILSDDVYAGHDIVLSVEPRVQAVLEKTLDETKNKYEAVEAGGIIMDPQTGAIIAMAAKPDFDPNNYNIVSDLKLFGNPLTSHLFEMGSVIKPLTLSAALDEGKITAETTYTDQGYVVINGKRIENYDGKARGKVKMQEVLNQSLNTGAVFVMRQLGRDDFKNYMVNFGLGEKTGIDLAGETSGNLKNLDSKQEVDYTTPAFGQGISMTPMEFAAAAASLANGGLLMRPYIVDKIILQGGTDKTTLPEIKRRVLKKETSEEITRMLVEVVDKALLGGTVKLERYSVAAKTGTAQLSKPKEEGSGYYEDRYMHTFFGYAPAFDAKFLIFLYVKEPNGVQYASHSLTPPFMELMKFLLNYYQVPPDR